MLDIYDEFSSIITTLEQHSLEYAVCGGLAVALHGVERATLDIDLLILASSLDAVTEVVAPLGYSIKGLPMTFKGGAVEIRCISKIDPESGDLMRLDLLLVTPETEAVWQTKQQAEWDEGLLWVVSRDGLVKLKQLSGRPQDLADIARLQEKANEC
jgi:hypothetical protein